MTAKLVAAARAVRVRLVVAGVLVGLAVVASAAVAAAPASASFPDPLSGDFPVGVLLCNPSDWHYAPETKKYYEEYLTDEDPGEFRTLRNFFEDESYGKMTLKGSRVRGWYHMTLGTEAFSEGGFAIQWKACVNAALAAGQSITQYEGGAIAVVTPWVNADTASKIPAETLPFGDKHPPAQRIVVDSTANFPPTPFVIEFSEAPGEYALVEKVVSGKELEIVRGETFAGNQAPGPFASYPADERLQSQTYNDKAEVGPQTVYEIPDSQPCSSGLHGLCPTVSYSPVGSNSLTLSVGETVLQAGDEKDGAYSNGIGDFAHEVGHTTDYNHSRTLVTSETDYGDQFDQMSYNLGVPKLPRCPAHDHASLPCTTAYKDDISNYDAIDLEYHGWIPANKQFNPTNKAVHQSTIQLHALSDPDALGPHAHGDLDAHLPAKVTIEDEDPKQTNPAVPAECGVLPGQQCETSSYYTVEYRQAYGFDYSLEGSSAEPGILRTDKQPGLVLLHLAVTNPINSADNISFLVNSQPGVAKGPLRKNKAGELEGSATLLANDGAMFVGEDFADAAHNTYVAVNSMNSKSKSAIVTVSASKIRVVQTVQVTEFPDNDSDKVVDTVTTPEGAPVPDQKVAVSVGKGPALCTARTSDSGVANCSSVSRAMPGALKVTFIGDKAYRRGVWP